MKTKIALEIESDSESNKKGLPVITHALPFFKSKQNCAKYFHRVRSINNHRNGDRHMHTSIRLWCGANGFIGEGSGQLYATVPENEIRCAVCEGKAIGAGKDAARIINGKQVMFSPRK